MIVLVIFLIAGSEVHLDQDTQIAKHYLEQKGYTVKTYNGDHIYTFSKEQLVEKPHIFMWAVQRVKPDAFIGKEIKQEIFIVKNHPLSKVYEKGIFSSGIEVRVWMYNGKVIGGTSFPAEEMTGTNYSIDGKDMEEIVGDYKDWYKKWVAKYGN